MPKRQICFTCSDKLYKKLMKMSKDSGLPLSKVIELKLNGFTIAETDDALWS
jgi:hypothetical protein